MSRPRPLAGLFLSASLAGAALITGADATLAPCVIVSAKVELLAACAFTKLVPSPDAGAADAAAADAQ